MSSNRIAKFSPELHTHAKKKLPVTRNIPPLQFVRFARTKEETKQSKKIASPFLNSQLYSAFCLTKIRAGMSFLSFVISPLLMERG